MKRFVLMFAALGLLFACTPEENNTGDNDGTVHVTGISLDRPTATIKEGESITLVATVTPANADNKNVTWSTSSEAVATVGNNGKVTGVKAGSATITAMTEDGGKKATCALTVEANLAPSVTVGAEHISAVSVVLIGKANIINNGSSTMIMGFQYYKLSGSTSPTAITVLATDPDKDYNYSVSISELEPNTSYLYYSFARQNGQDTYGEAKEFTTKDIASLLETNEASDVEATSAMLNAKLDLTDVQYESLAYGFLWGSSESALNTDFKCTEIKDNAIAATLTSLSNKTQYWYKAYVKLDSQTFYGDVKTFTTDIVPVQSVSLDKTEYTFHTIGNTLTLNATVFPSDATDKSVEWSSDKEDVATVDQNGKVTAKANGKAIITVTTKDQNKTASCEVEVKQYVTSMTLSKTSLSLVIGEEETISVTSILPDNANDKTYTWSSSDNAIATVDNSGKVTAKAKGNTVIKATANDGSGVTASCEVTVSSVCPDGAVDLGLTTSKGYRLYWATCNLSESGFVSSPEVYGDYYAWGETETYYSSQDPLNWKSGKTGYNWASYSLCNGSLSTLTKYNYDSNYGTVDNKTALDPEDDVAHVKLGGKWRMPTDEEWTALRTKCTWTWTTNYNGSGVAGRIVKSNVEGYKDKSIFLPAAGLRVGTSLSDVGSSGRFWSSSPGTGFPGSAWGVYFYSDGVNGNDRNRYYGLSVRPVSE